VLTFQSPVFCKGEFQSLAFYDGLAKSFTELGHNVLLVTTSDFLTRPFHGSNKAATKFLQHQALDNIKKFRPDLVISFNNSSIENLDKEISCPIAIWNADDPIFFNDLNHIKNNVDRYHYMSFSEEGMIRYKEAFNVPDNLMAIVPSATSIQNRQEKKLYDISFIGSNFFNSQKLAYFLQAHPEYLSYSQKKLLSLKKEVVALLSTYNCQFDELLFCKSADKRTSLILSLLDHDLTIFGPSSWQQLTPFASKIARAYNPAIVYSLQQNELVYNRSKISLNVRHAQNIHSYPWRVADILASNAVLLTDPSAQLTNDFSKKVDLQIFSSASEAYYIAKKLLNDNRMRQDIIAQQNNAINQGFRWKHRFPIMQELTGVNLAPIPNKTGKCTKLALNHDYSTDLLVKLSSCFFSAQKNIRNAPRISTKRRILTYLLSKCLSKKLKNSLNINVDKIRFAKHRINLPAAVVDENIYK
jgi:spore maturation protein CgeB